MLVLLLMNYIDILLTIPLLIAAWKGFKKGLIIEIFSLIALIGGIWGGLHYSVQAEPKIKELIGTEEYTQQISFLIVFIAVAIGVYFLGKLLEKIVSLVALGFANKMLGLFFSTLKTAYILSVVTVLFLSINGQFNLLSNKVCNESLLLKPLSQLSILTIPKLKESKIGEKINFDKVDPFFQLEDNDNL